jgi:hypothetical protein
MPSIESESSVSESSVTEYPMARRKILFMPYPGRERTVGDSRGGRISSAIPDIISLDDSGMNNTRTIASPTMAGHPLPVRPGDMDAAAGLPVAYT